MILSAQTIRKLRLVSPLREAYVDELGNSAGLSACGVDLILDQDITLVHSQFKLASTRECFALPSNVMGVVHDKSSLARRGLAVQNTVLEPNWQGWLTLELSYHGGGSIHLPRNAAVAQVVFHFLDEPTELPYAGKYQNQAPGPQQYRSASGI